MIIGYMVITHPHLDHFSDIENIKFALPKVLWRCKSYTRNELLENARYCDRNKIIQYCDFVDSYNTDITPLESPRSDFAFDGLTAQCFSTNLCNKSNKNNFSAIVVIRLGNAKIVVCGDNEKESFEYLMRDFSFREAVSSAWVLIAPHHGRESGYYDDFVTLVNPYLTIISDTSNVETSVSSKYSAKSRGWNVYNELTRKFQERSCLTTRQDGNIEVEFGESYNPGKVGYLNVSIHK
jgi:beta-lactamase superfamily II metal-dependent hydrolase